MTSCDWGPVTQGLFDVVAAHRLSTTGQVVALPDTFSRATVCDNENGNAFKWRTQQALRWMKNSLSSVFSESARETGSYKCVHLHACPSEPYTISTFCSDRIFFNNFEVMDLSWMRSQEYRAAFKAIDADGGIYRRRWGDAPIRTLLALTLLPLDELHHFRVVGYRHPGLSVGPWYDDPLPVRSVHPGYPEEKADAIAIIEWEIGHTSSGTSTPQKNSFLSATVELAAQREAIMLIVAFIPLILLILRYLIRRCR